MPRDRIAPVNLCSSIFFKYQRNLFALVNLWKRSTMIVLIPSIFAKDQREWFNLFHNQIYLLITKTIYSIKKQLNSQPWFIMMFIHCLSLHPNPAAKNTKKSKTLPCVSLSQARCPIRRFSGIELIKIYLIGSKVPVFKNRQKILQYITPH